MRSRNQVFVGLFHFFFDMSWGGGIDSVLSQNMIRSFAHSGNHFGVWHSLKEHLASVSLLAGGFLEGFEGAGEAVLAGLFHDLGKYGDDFQARLRGEKEGLDHWSQGAWIALTNHRSVAAALAIQGHHIGLQWADQGALRGLEPAKLVQRHPLNLKLSEPDLEVLMNRFADDGLISNSINATAAYPFNTVSSMLDVRMIFSALVDADFLDTEAHFNGTERGKQYRAKGPDLDAERAIKILDEYHSALGPKNPCAEPIRFVRERLWDECAKSGRQSPGLWTLTAPTGSGKTLGMLKFALEHAISNGLKRIVFVIPFLSIIDQSAKEYRDIFKEHFGGQYVLEHHSLAGLGSESSQADAEANAEQMRRLLSENWDAPIVVTTSVQMLESLFSNRPSACRKLHRLANSVILFDEVQTLPTHLLVPTLAALSHLCSKYGCSVVFSTATQPAFDHLDGAVAKHTSSGWKPRAVVEKPEELFELTRRTRIIWPNPGEKTSLQDLAGRMADRERFLCVVNLKRHALKLMEYVSNEDGVFHLSTNLCPAHRTDVLQQIRLCLKSAEPCRLISTQCVEAGVDVDFPLVYRAMGPLEAIAQVAGRCNRNGLIPVGEVRVFAPENDTPEDRWMYPTFAYFQASSMTEILLKEKGTRGLDIDDPKTFQEYYRRLYDLNKPETQAQELDEAIQAQHFPKVADLYRVISQDTISILVPYQERLDEFRNLRKGMDGKGLSAEWIRRAQSFSVSLFRPKLSHPLMGLLVPAKLPRGGVSDEWFILGEEFSEYYDSVLGIKPPEAPAVLIY